MTTRKITKDKTDESLFHWTVELQLLMLDFFNIKDNEEFECICINYIDAYKKGLLTYNEVKKLLIYKAYEITYREA